MGLEVVEEEGGLCQICWRFFGSSAAFRALEREISLLAGRQRGTEEVGFPLALPSQQQDHGCLLQPSSLGQTGVCVAPRVEPLIGNHGT